MAAPQDRSLSVTSAVTLPWRLTVFFMHFQGCLAIPCPRDKAFEHFLFMIDCTPKPVPLAVDFRKDPLVYASMPCRSVPSFRCHCQSIPGRIFSGLLRPISAVNIGLKRFHQKPAVMKKSDTTRVRKVFDVAQRQWKPDIHHHG